MKESNQKRGWRRIGIVLSIVWFVGFAGFIWIWSNRERGDFYSYQLGMCYRLLEVNNEALQYLTPDAAEKRRAENWVKHESCKSEASDFLRRRADEENSSAAIGILLAVDAATVALGWLLVWFFVSIVQWIRRGFQSAKTRAASPPACAIVRDRRS
jgi:hypothetical protein